MEKQKCWRGQSQSTVFCKAVNAGDLGLLFHSTSRGAVPKTPSPRNWSSEGNPSGPLGRSVMSVYIVQKPQD